MSAAPPRAERRDRPLRVFGFDPGFGTRLGNHLTLRLPFEPLGAGPRGHYLEVVDPNYELVDLEQPAIIVANGLEQCMVAGEGPESVDVKKIEKLFLGLA